MSLAKPRRGIELGANKLSFSYGSYLIWFNVMNGTASIILGSAPYNFRYYLHPYAKKSANICSTAMVGLSYVSCCFGAILGYVPTIHSSIHPLTIIAPSSPAASATGSPLTSPAATTASWKPNNASGPLQHVSSSSQAH